MWYWTFNFFFNLEKAFWSWKMCMSATQHLVIPICWQKRWKKMHRNWMHYSRSFLNMKWVVFLFFLSSLAAVIRVFFKYTWGCSRFYDMKHILGNMNQTDLLIFDYRRSERSTAFADTFSPFISNHYFVLECLVKRVNQRNFLEFLVSCGSLAELWLWCG